VLKPAIEATCTISQSLTPTCFNGSQAPIREAMLLVPCSQFLTIIAAHLTVDHPTITKANTF
jgi:hypothetical protein